jgi:NADP-dependent 3-hydroxy acid dehydrogenase YdfG
MEPLAGKTALVTGATGAIGRAVAGALAREGMTLLLAGRDAASLNAQRAELDRLAPSGTTRTLLVDFDDWEGKWLNGMTGLEPDVLVHCAGSILLKNLSETTAEEFDHQVQANLRGPFLLTRALLPHLVRCQGQVVFVNSSAARQAARSNLWAYTASKAGLTVLADALRDEVNHAGVRVLSVYPGRTASRMQETVHAFEGRTFDPQALLQPDDVAAQIVAALKLPRTAEVTDIAIRPFRKT